MQHATPPEKPEALQGKALLEVRNLRVWFPIRTGFFSSLFGRKRGYINAVDGVSFNVKAGEIFCLAGESGSGKTTLGKSLLRLVGVTSGNICYDTIDILSLERQELRSIRKNIQMIYQDPYEALPPHMNVFDIIAEPLEVNRLASSFEEKEAKVTKALEAVGLTPYEVFLDKYPHQLSGGQRQRVAIASVLVLRPRLVVADEPVSMLDVSIRTEVVKLMLDLKNRFGLTYLLITHDLALASYIADRIAIMYLGKIVELSDTKELVENPVHPYTQALLSVVPVADPTLSRKRIILRGEIPSPSNIPLGCRFHPRCPIAEEICKQKPVELLELKPGHYVACHLVEKSEAVYRASFAKGA